MIKVWFIHPITFIQQDVKQTGLFIECRGILDFDDIVMLYTTPADYIFQPKDNIDYEKSALQR